jgi:hypothetical protein
VQLAVGHWITGFISDVAVGLRESPYLSEQSWYVYGGVVVFHSRVPADMIECPPRMYRRDALKAALNLFNA